MYTGRTLDLMSFRGYIETGLVMIVVIPKRSGFCPGVKNAEKNIFHLKETERASSLFVYGYLINNKKYIEFLRRGNVQTVETLDQLPAGATVIIRTHGLDRNEERLLREKCNVVDLTCVNVKKAQHEIALYAGKGFLTVIVGTKDHPETKGLVSYAEKSIVVENEGDLGIAREHITQYFLKRPHKRIFVCAQTTGSRELFEKTISVLQEQFPKDQTTNLAVYNSICPVTERKEQEARALQKNTDVSFVVGDRISSNSRKLFRILSAEAPGKVHFVEDLAELRALQLPLATYRKALVVSSASTPRFIEDEIVTYLSAVKAEA